MRTDHATPAQSSAPPRQRAWSRVRGLLTEPTTFLTVAAVGLLISAGLDVADWDTASWIVSLVTAVVVAVLVVLTLTTSRPTTQ